MGGDGGSFASGRKYLLGTKESRDGGSGSGSSSGTKYTQMERSRTCALSNNPLVEPIVACELGYLYNKEAVITALLDKSLSSHNGGTFSHIRKVKDVVRLILCPNPAAAAAGPGSSASKRANTSVAIGGLETEAALAAEASQFICPLTRYVLCPLPSALCTVHCPCGLVMVLDAITK